MRIKINYLIYFTLISIITSSCNISGVKDKLLTGLFKRESTNKLLLNSIRQNLYKSNLDISDSLLNMIDSLTLSENEKGDYCLTKGFLYHNEGKINNSVVYLNIASNIFSETGSEEEHAEANLIWGIVFEDTHLLSEASKSYFKALEYYNDHHSSQYFYTLIGLARTVTDNDIFMKKAYSYLEENPDNYLERLYYNTKACIANDAQTKHQLFLLFLHKYYNSGSIREQINMYASVALSCCMVGKNDSAIYYIRQAEPFVETNTIHNSKIIHYYLIKSFIYLNNKQYNIAKSTIDTAIVYAKNQPGLLSQAYLRNSELEFEQKHFKKAYNSLRLFIYEIKNQIEASQKNQLNLLTIRYKLHDKQMQILKLRNLGFSIVISLLIGILLLIIMLVYIKHKLYLEKQAMQNLISLTIKERDEWQKKFEFSKTILDDINLENQDFFEWDNFRISFIIKHPNFIDNIKDKHPEITSVNLKYCMCISCGMNNKQTANLLDVTYDAVKKAKRKLKRVFNLKNIDALSDYLNMFYCTSINTLTKNLV